MVMHTIFSHFNLSLSTVAFGGFAWLFCFLVLNGSIMHKQPPNNSPEPPPIADLVPHSRLTLWAARLSFCR